MIWLGIDTSTHHCRACLWHSVGGKILCEESQEIGTGHAELLMRQIDTLFADRPYQRSDLTQIVCSIGPGSFTGVRVGLSAAKALAQALSIPLIGVSTLESLAIDMARISDGPFSVALDARRGQLYWQSFDASGAAISAPSIAVPDALTHLRETKVAGSGAELLTMLPYLEDKATGSMGAMMYAAREKSPLAEPLIPLYLRSADAKQPKTPFAVARQKGAKA